MSFQQIVLKDFLSVGKLISEAISTDTIHNLKWSLSLYKHFVVVCWY